MQYNKKNQQIKNEQELLKSILEANRDLIVANKNFDIAENDLIDYYSYQIKASKAKLDYLIKQVKQKGISVDIINNIKLTLDDINVI